MECFVCRRTPDERELRVRRFNVMYYLCEEPICRNCLEAESGEDTEWKQPWDLPPEGVMA